MRENCHESTRQAVREHVAALNLIQQLRCRISQELERRPEQSGSSHTEDRWSPTCPDRDSCQQSWRPHPRNYFVEQFPVRCEHTPMTHQVDNPVAPIRKAISATVGCGLYRHSIPGR